MNLSTANTPKRVLSGMRPTGKLHLGNYMGALRNWVGLQDEYTCFFFIADFHALTTDYADPSNVKKNIVEVAMDFIAAGLNPEKSAIFVQSDVPEHAELFTLFSMFTPLSWLERVPTYKDQIEQLKEKDLGTYGFLGYPLLQAADILLYRPDFVPVGQDQVAHVELTREVSRRFNSIYGKDPALSNRTAWEPGQITPTPDEQVLPEPQVLITASPKLPGLDGRKMSKSYNNTILLSENAFITGEKVLAMSNGGQRPLQTDPGDPDICPVGDMHALFSSSERDEHIRFGCRNATISCRECKALAALSINEHLQPIRDRRRALEKNPGQIAAILESGAAKAREAAQETMKIVRDAMGLGTYIPQQRMNWGLTIAPPASLEKHKDWWNLTPLLYGKHIREFWLENIIPTDISLKRSEELVYIASKNRRVLVRTSQEMDTSNHWNFTSKAKSYEVLALLCWQKDDFILQDFIIPQKFYIEEWSRLKKLGGKEIQFAIWTENSRFLLELGSLKIDITDMRGDYSPLR